METLLNPYVQCPYNRAHQVPKLRLQHHIIKCRKNYENIDKRICPFNATHILPSSKFATHLLKCPDRRRLEAHKYNDEEEDSGDLGNPSFYAEVPYSYSWEEDDPSGQNSKRAQRSTWSEHVKFNSGEPEGVGIQDAPRGRGPGALEPQMPDNYYLNDQEPTMDSKSSEISLPSEAKSSEESQVKQISRNWMGLGRGRVHQVLSDLKKVP